MVVLETVGNKARAREICNGRRGGNESHAKGGELDHDGGFRCFLEKGCKG